MSEIRKEGYRVLLTGGEGEYIEKKSRFIATLRKCDSEAAAMCFVEEMKKKYWDARHNCHAFVIGDRGELTRCSDDGEPGGTAGRPMLEVLINEELRNVAVVVTRYFGGVLLGTGGLVRAYTQAVKEGLKNCQIGRMRYGCEAEMVTDYNSIGRILYILGNRGLEPLSADYGEKIVLRLVCPSEDFDSLQKDLVNAANGKAFFEKKNELYYVDKSQESV